jgi:hypothetical protein
VYRSRNVGPPTPHGLLPNPPAEGLREVALEKKKVRLMLFILMACCPNGGSLIRPNPVDFLILLSRVCLNRVA